MQIQQVTQEIAEAIGLEEPRGALVADVTGGSPADEAGIEVGDVILGFAGEPVDEMRDLPIAVAESPIGQPAEVTLWRDGEEVTVAPKIARLEAPSGERPQPRDQGDEAPPELGLSLSPLTPDLRRELGLGEGATGVVVTGVKPGSPAAEQDVQPGDLITGVGGKLVETTGDVARAVDAARRADQKTVLVLRRRDDVQSFVPLPLQTG